MTSPSQGKVGTTVVEGLIEGPVPPRKDGEAVLRQWASFASENGFHFDLSIDGPSFSLLPDGTPLSLDKAGDPQDTLRQVIDQLLQVFPEDLRGSIFSTVRSTEYRDGVMVLTVYALTPKGVKVQAREIEWEKKKSVSGLPFPKLSTPLVIATLVVVLALVFSMFVVDYRSLFERVTGQFRSIDLDAIELDDARVGRYVTCRKVGWDKTNTRLVLELKRTSEFPGDLAAYAAEEERVSETGDLRELLALRRIVVYGSVLVTYLDKDGRTLATGEHGIRKLLDQESVLSLLPLREHPRTAKLQIGY